MTVNILLLGQATLSKRQARSFLFIMPFISLEKGNRCNDQTFIIHRDNKFRKMFNDCEIINSFCKDTQPSDNHPKKDTQPNLALEWTLTSIIINIMTFSIQTLSSMTQSKTTQSLMTLNETTMNTNTSTTIVSFFCHFFHWENTAGGMNNDLLSLADYKLRKMCNSCEIINHFCKDTHPRDNQPKETA
jgi:hypothetical protein